MYLICIVWDYDVPADNTYLGPFPTAEAAFARMASLVAHPDYANALDMVVGVLDATAI